MSERSELGDFLRARRASLRPVDVGLPESGRRRTPGLRREEVATLAGVSIDYLVRLEQGRDVNPSPAVQAALARALRLTSDERLHLAKLAAREANPSLCPEPAPLVPSIAPGVRQLLDSIDTVLAFVIGPAGHLVGWNRQWESLVIPLGLLDEQTPNLTRWLFVDLRARTIYEDWAAAADEQVSRLRAAQPRWGEDPTFRALLDELMTVPEFATRWPEHHVQEKRRGRKRLRHPVLGLLDVTYEVLDLPDDDGQRFVTWMPADDRTASAFHSGSGRVATSPPQLRVVSEQ